MSEENALFSISSDHCIPIVTETKGSNLLQEERKTKRNFVQPHNEMKAINFTEFEHKESNIPNTNIQDFMQVPHTSHRVND